MYAMYRYVLQRWKSIQVSWLLSYMAVLFIPLLTGLLIYSESMKELRSETLRANASLLQQVRYTMDSHISSMKRLQTEIAFNETLRHLLNPALSFDELGYAAYESVQELNKYRVSYPAIDEFYVAWDNQALILRPGNIRNMQLAFETIHQTDHFEYRQWLDMIRYTTKGRFVILPYTDSSMPQSTIAYVSPLPKDFSGRSAGTVVIMMDIERLNKALLSIEHLDKGNLMILDQDNQLLFSSIPKIEGESVPSDPSEIVSISSEVSDLRYNLVVRNDWFWGKAERLRHFAYTCIFVSLLGAGILTWFFLRRNTANIQTEAKTIAHLVQNHRQRLRSDLLGRLLKGKLIPHQESLESLQLQFQANDFAVILLTVESHEKLYDHLPGKGPQEKRQLIQFVMTNVMEELAGKKLHQAFVTDVDDTFACLICLNRMDKEHMALKEQLLEITSEVQQFLARYRADVTIAVSGVHAGLSGVPNAYREASEAMEYKMLLGKRNIIFHEDILLDPGLSYKYHYPLDEEYKLINFVKTGDYPLASRLLNEIIQRNTEGRIIPVVLARCLIFNLAGTMIKAIHELGVEDSSTFGDSPWMDTIIACDTIEELKKELQVILHAACQFAAARRKTSANQERADSVSDLISSVVQYVQDCFHDPNLNVNMVGDRFRLSAGYLSKLFKDETGTGLSDYINKHRIQEAKERIVHKERESSISDIAKRVGFHEAATFIRVFKKYEGVTPGKYKEMIGGR
jgi:two-component system, response regulator YesN